MTDPDRTQATAERLRLALAARAEGISPAPDAWRQVSARLERRRRHRPLVISGYALAALTAVSALFLAVGTLQDQRSTEVRVEPADQMPLPRPPGTVDNPAPADTGPISPPPFPPERTDPEHGGLAWAVVLAGADTFEAPSLQAAVGAAQDAGFTTGPTDCDQGAPEALGLPRGHYTVSVLFRSEADANAALAAFNSRGYDGGAVAEIRTYCLD